MHEFALPPTLAEDEFKIVWSTIENELKSQGRTFADEGTTEEKAREEYRAIAERRVRLGLVLSEIGDKNNITVTEDEVKRAIVERARQVPGREQQVWEYYQKNPEAVAAMRAPIFEEKVVDFLVELASVSEKQVTREEELVKEEEEWGRKQAGRAAERSGGLSPGHPCISVMRASKKCVAVLEQDGGVSPSPPADRDRWT